MNRYFLLLLLAVAVLSACTPHVDGIASDLSGQSLEMIVTALPSDLPTTSTLAPTPTNGVSADVTIVSTETSTESAVNPITTQRVCTTLPQRFDFRAELGIYQILDLRFENEDILTFEGWTGRPDASLAPQTPEPTPDMMPGPYPSAGVLLVAGQLNIPDGIVEPRTIAFAPLLNNPCGEACPLEIISQSPDERWQLVQVNDWLREKMGIWLVGEKDMVKLTRYVPFGLDWQWADDSSMLWLEYSDPDRGGSTLVVYLENPIIVNETEYGSALDPTFYFPDFSPTEKVVLSTANPFELGVDTDELFTLNLTESLTQTASTQVIPGLISADWNDATQSYLLQIVNRNDAEIQSVEIQNQDGQVLVTIPQNILYSIETGLSLGEKPVPSYRFSLPGQYALSSSGRYVAKVKNSSEIWLFDCSLQN
jgi:hypothetical protein